MEFGDIFLLFLIAVVFIYTFWDDVFTDTQFQVIVHFSFERSKEKRTKKKKPFNVSLPLHWASLRSSSLKTDSTVARNIWNLARAFHFQ